MFVGIEVAVKTVYHFTIAVPSNYDVRRHMKVSTITAYHFTMLCGFD